jgi:hypothetical protein
MPTKAQELAHNPLCQELGKIGRLLHPLDPAKLIGRASILDTSTVHGLVGAQASEADKAHYAAKAIRIAVSRVTPLRDGHIAEAMFGLGEFDGKTITARKELLEGPPYHISRDEYAKRRPWALEGVAHNLPYAYTELFPSAKYSATVRPDRFVEIVTFLAHDVTEMMFTALSVLFVTHDAILGAYASPLLASRCNENLLLRLLSLLEFTRLHSETLFEDTVGPHSLQFALNGILSLDTDGHLPDGCAKAISAEYATLLDTFPFEDEDYVRLTLLAAKADGDLEKINVIPRELFEKWRLWHQEMHPPFPFSNGQPIVNNDALKPLEAIVLSCQKIEASIGRYIDYPWAIISSARLRIYKRLAYLYAVEEWVPEASDGPLRSRVEQYFDSTLKRIAKTI